MVNAALTAVICALSYNNPGWPRPDISSNFQSPSASPQPRALTPSLKAGPSFGELEPGTATHLRTSKSRWPLKRWLHQSSTVSRRGDRARHCLEHTVLGQFNWVLLGLQDAAQTRNKALGTEA